MSPPITNNIMQIKLPTDKSFDCPEGIHTGEFYEHRPTTKPTQNGIETYLRLVFQVEAQSSETKLVLVGRNFVPTLHQGSDLRLMLDSWLGEDFLETHAFDSKFDFEILNGRKADLVVKHIQNEGHRKPYVYLEGVFPPGSITHHAKEGI